MFNDIVPTNFDDFILNKSILGRFKTYNIDNLNHLLLIGYGKKTIIDAFLLHLFKKKIKKYIQIYKIRINNNDVTINIIKSEYHYEINLYEYGYYDKHIICEFIKDLISTKNVSNNKYKIIILHYFNKVHRQAQLSLRRLMELNINTCRFFIMSKSLCNIEPAIISRCDLINIPYPKKEIDEYIDFCSKTLNKDINKYKIIKKSKYSLFKLNTLIFNNDYVDPMIIYVKQIHDILLKTQSILFIDEIRKIIYKIHLLNLNPSDLFNTYIRYITIHKLFTDEIIYKIVEQAALNELQSKNMTKYFFCLERFFIFIKRYI